MSFYWNTGMIRIQCCRHSIPTAGFVPWAAVSVHLASIQQTQRGSFHAADESESPASATRQPELSNTQNSPVHAEL